MPKERMLDHYHLAALETKELHPCTVSAKQLGIPPAVLAAGTLPGPSDRGQNLTHVFPYPERPSVHCSNAVAYFSLMICATLGKHQGPRRVQSFAILNEHCRLLSWLKQFWCLLICTLAGTWWL